MPSSAILRPRVLVVWLFRAYAKMVRAPCFRLSCSSIDPVPTRVSLMLRQQLPTQYIISVFRLLSMSLSSGSFGCVVIIYSQILFSMLIKLSSSICWRWPDLSAIIFDSVNRNALMFSFGIFLIKPLWRRLMRFWCLLVTKFCTLLGEYWHVHKKPMTLMVLSSRTSSAVHSRILIKGK